jgi:hypothetical protein
MAVKIMNLRNIKSIWSVKSLVMATTLIACATIAPGAAQAGQMSQGWNYSIDSFKDGTEGGKIGSTSKFEFYGLAFREYKNKVVFAVNSNLSREGYAYANAQGGNIGYGDMFLNFGDKTSFKNSDGTSNMYGVNFANNDSGLANGLYTNAKAQSLTRSNSGYTSLAQHTNTVKNLTTADGQQGAASYGDLGADTTYFDQSFGQDVKVWKDVRVQVGTKQVQKEVVKRVRIRGQWVNQTVWETVTEPVYETQRQQVTETQVNNSAATHIKSGTYSSGITMIDSFSDKSKLDFSKFGATGQYTFGFSIDKSKLQTGNFVASLFAECGNDGVVINGKILGDTGIRSVPESSPLAGLAVIGMVGGALALRKRQQAKLDA